MIRLPSMGKNLPAKKHTIGNPTQLKLRYILEHNATALAGNNDSHFIDIARGLSAVNRRFYRQGLYYHVASVTVHDSNQNVWCKFATAPDTYWVKNAWIRGFRAWSKLNSEAAKSAQMNGDDLALAGKYHDFKIFLNQNHKDHQENGTDVPVPIGSQDYLGVQLGDLFDDFIKSPQEFVYGDWDYSELRTMDPPSDPTFMHLLGDHETNSNTDYVSYGLCKGYFDTKNQVPMELPAQSDDLNTDYVSNLFDSSDEFDNILEDLEDKNDDPPYHRTLIAQDTMIQEQTANSAGAGAVTRTGGFTVPFGLLEVITNSATDGKVEVVIELTAGTYNGVAAARVC